MPTEPLGNGAASPPLGSGGASGAGAMTHAASTRGTWAAVYDELRSHQSLSSVVNDPRGKGLLRGKWEGISDLFEAVGEIVEEIGEARESEAQEGIDAAVIARTDELVGAIPGLPDFQPYLDTFADLWDIYYKSMKGKSRKPTKLGLGHAHSLAQRDDGSEDVAACDAYRSVPHEYFSNDFKLEHHQIFKQSLQTSIDQQEELNSELTGYLDLIEVSLFEQIQRAQRDQVFDSLANMNQPLQEDLRSTLGVLKTLRGQLRSVQKRQLRNGLAVGRLARRKLRAEEVLQRLDCLAHVQQSQPSIQMLLQGQDYITALDLLETTTAAHESNLKGLTSARPSSTRLVSFLGTFDRSVEADFVHHSTEAILSGATSSTTPAASPSASAAIVTPVPPELKGAERIKRLCWCLGRRELLRPALSATLRDVLLSQLKKVLKTRARTLLEESGVGETSANGSTGGNAGAGDTSGPAASPGSGDAGENPAEEGSAAPGSSEAATAQAAVPQKAAIDAPTGMSAALCALGFDGFLAFWRSMLQDCLEVAARFCEYAALVQGVMGSLIEDAASRQTGRDQQLGPESELLRLFEILMNSYLQKVGVLLQARQAEHRTLRADEWNKLLKLSYDALDKVRGLQDQCRQLLPAIETHSGTDVRSGVRAILYAQTKHIVDEFDKLCIEKMECALEQERWERTDVPSQYKTILEQLLGKEQPVEMEVDQGVERFLHVEGVHFLVVPAALTLVQLLNDYVQLCRKFQSMPEVVIQRMCNMLKLFNGKTHQLVLGGQAVSQQTLRKITASNLALCSQCCGLVAQILPNLQSHLLKMFSVEPGQSPASSGSAVSSTARNTVNLLVGDLTKIATEYSDHRTALFGKLSDLLQERYHFHAKKWLGTPHAEIKDDSDAALFGEGAIASDGSAQNVNLNPHEALDGFVKDITNMYRVLLRNLTNDSVRKIFAKAFDEIALKFDQRLCQELAAPSPPYEERLGRSLGDRLALDIGFLQEMLEKLSGISTPLQRLLVDLVSHLRARMPADDPLRVLHPATLEALQRLGRLPR